MENQTQKPKKFINLIIPYQKQDIKLQKEQNELILRNTRWAVALGTLAVLAQLLEVVVSLVK